MSSSLSSETGSPIGSSIGPPADAPAPARAPAGRPAPAPPAAEEHDPVAADFGRVSLVAVLVVPLPRLQATLDVDLLALRQVLVQRLSPSCPTGRRDATRSFPAAGRPCRSTPRWWRGSASRPARRPACSAAPHRVRDCRPESLCSRCPFDVLSLLPICSSKAPPLWNCAATGVNPNFDRLSRVPVRSSCDGQVVRP